jgi:hypothetical protein
MASRKLKKNMSGGRNTRAKSEWHYWEKVICVDADGRINKYEDDRGTECMANDCRIKKKHKKELRRNVYFVADGIERQDRM